MTISPADELRTAVTIRAAGTGYLVRPTATGFDVLLDLSDMRSLERLRAERVRRLMQLRVVLDEPARRYTVTEDEYVLRWTLGMEGDPVPRLVASETPARNLGRTYGVSRSWTIGGDGRSGRAAEHVSTSLGARRIVAEAAGRLGWVERQGTATRVGVASGIVGLCIALAVTVGLLVTIASRGL